MGNKIGKNKKSKDKTPAMGCIPEPDPQRRQLFKVLLVGLDRGGKTCLMQRLVLDKFVDKYRPTIGADFRTWQDQGATLQLWDTAGQERFQSLGKIFYRGSDTVIIVASLENPLNVKSLSSHLSQINENSLKTSRFLVGNKLDLVDESTTSNRQALRDFAKKNGLIYRETSAKTGQGIVELFREITTCNIVGTQSAEISSVRMIALFDSYNRPFWVYLPFTSLSYKFD